MTKRGRGSLADFSASNRAEEMPAIAAFAAKKPNTADAAPVAEGPRPKQSKPGQTLRLPFEAACQLDELTAELRRKGLRNRRGNILRKHDLLLQAVDLLFLHHGKPAIAEALAAEDDQE